MPIICLTKCARQVCSILTLKLLKGSVLYLSWVITGASNLSEVLKHSAMEECKAYWSCWLEGTFGIWSFVIRSISATLQANFFPSVSTQNSGREGEFKGNSCWYLAGGQLALIWASDHRSLVPWSTISQLPFPAAGE